MANRERTKLTDQQKEAIELIVNNPFMHMEHVALKVGVDPATLSRWKNKEYFCEAFDKKKRDTYRYLGNKGLSEIEKFIHSENEKLRFDAAVYLSKLGGHVPVEKSEQKLNLSKSDPFEDITKEQIMEQLERYKQQENVIEIDGYPAKDSEEDENE